MTDKKEKVPTAKDILMSAANENPAEVFIVKIVNGGVSFSYKFDSPPTAALMRFVAEKEIAQAIENMAMRKPEEK